MRVAVCCELRGPRCLLAVVTVVLLLLPAAAARDAHGAESGQVDFTRLSLEELKQVRIIDMEVSSAARYRQKITRSPHAISVITAEDIRRSGAVTIPDLLRMVPGVDVANAYGDAFGVSARGYNERFAQRMLVMIDGRTIYTWFTGGTIWEVEEVFLEDIERIEVIRGPSATLWGANSVTGVINIITKDPEDDPGLLLSQRVGTQHHLESTVRYSGALSPDVHVSLTAGYRESEHARGTKDYCRVPKATARLKYRMGPDSVLHLFCGFSEQDGGVETTKYYGRSGIAGRVNYQMLRWNHSFSPTSDLQVQGFRRQFQLHADNKDVFIEEDIYNLDVQHSFRAAPGNRVLWGLNYRNTQMNSTYNDPRRDSDDLIGCFFQDEIEITGQLTLIAGIKYENNSFTGRDFSPRASLLYSPSSQHHFRLAVARAFRTPGFSENSLYLRNTLPTPFERVPVVTTRGNRHLEPERMTSCELGYRTVLFDRAGFNVELYYSELDRVIDYALERRGLPVQVRFENAYDTVARGIEIELDFPVTEWWTLTANYTWQSVEKRRANQDLTGVPRHKCNLRSYVELPGNLSVTATLHYVDATKWWLGNSATRIDDYLRLDLRVAKTFRDDRLELSVVGQNLTDRLHPEMSDGVGTYEVERLVYGQIVFRFK